MSKNKWDWTPELQKQLDAAPDKEAFMDKHLGKWTEGAQGAKLTAEEIQTISKLLQAGTVKPDAWVEYKHMPWWAFWNGRLRWRLTVKCCGKHEPKVYARFMDKEHGHHMAMLIAQSLGRKYKTAAVARTKRDGKPPEIVDLDTDAD